MCIDETRLVLDFRLATYSCLNSQSATYVGIHLHIMSQVHVLVRVALDAPWESEVPTRANKKVKHRLHQDRVSAVFAGAHQTHRLRSLSSGMIRVKMIVVAGRFMYSTSPRSVESSSGPPPHKRISGPAIDALEDSS